MRTLDLAALSIIAIAIASPAVRLLHLTDPHLFADPAAGLRGTVTADSLAAVLTHVVDSGWPSDLVAVTGDLIQDDSSSAYQRFREQLAALGGPVHCVPGNHDVRALMQAALDAPPFRYCAAIELGNWLIVGVDSCMSGSAAGRVADDELQRLAELLAHTAMPHALVCLHHPPLSVGSRWLDQVGLENRSAFLDVLRTSGKVRACLFGHAHQAIDVTLADGIRLLGTPSTCSQFLPGSDVFAIDEQPPAYRRITLQDSGDLHEELVWVPFASRASA